MPQKSAITPEQFNDFGELLKFLRRRAGLTQRELSIGVGYSESQISRLEKNERTPDVAAIAARFVPELDLEQEPTWVARLLELATSAHISSATDSENAVRQTRLENLPVQPTGFVGRAQELADLKQWLTGKGSEGDARLVTLTGVGGSGKTRLALRAAAELIPDFPDGVFFVNLAPLTEADLVIPTIAQTLGVSALPRQTTLAALQEHLHAKRQLLVLDNFEQVLDAAPPLVDLLMAAPFLKILVTSRVVLHLSVEREFRVPPLPVPNSDKSSLEELAQNDAVALFMQRAQNVRQDIQLTKISAPAVAEICVRLDGLPLAIELAAARTRILSPEELLARLSRRLGLLTGGARDLPSRQQTLRNTIDWSYQLLPAREQKLFVRLGVFVGGWTLDAAEHLCNMGGDPGNIVDGLQTLVDHNLVQQQVTRYGSVRFTMLETLREYALEHLEASGEGETLRQRHAKYFLALVDAEAAIAVTENAYSDWIEAIIMEDDNLRAALTWSQTVPGNAEMGLRMAEAMTWFASWEEAQSWCERVLEHADAEGDYDSHSRAEVLESLGQNLAMQGDYTAGERRFASSLELFRALGDRLATARLLERWGWSAREQGRTETAIARLEEGLALSRELELDYLVCIVTNTLAEALTMEGNTVAAKTLLEGNLILARHLDHTSTVGWTLNHLGHVAQIDREYELARRLHTESLVLFRELHRGDSAIAEALHCLGEIALADGDDILATTHLSESLLICQESRYRVGVAWCLAGLAGVAVLEEEPKRAGFLWGAAEQLRQRLGTREGPATHATHQRLMEQARAELGDTAFEAAWARGKATPLEEVVAQAMELQPDQI